MHTDLKAADERRRSIVATNSISTPSNKNAKSFDALTINTRTSSATSPSAAAVPSFNQSNHGNSSRPVESCKSDDENESEQDKTEDDPSIPPTSPIDSPPDSPMEPVSPTQRRNSYL